MDNISHGEASGKVSEKDLRAKTHDHNPFNDRSGKNILLNNEQQHFRPYHTQQDFIEHEFSWYRQRCGIINIIGFLDLQSLGNQQHQQRQPMVQWHPDLPANEKNQPLQLNHQDRNELKRYRLGLAATSFKIHVLFFVIVSRISKVLF